MCGWSLGGSQDAGYGEGWHLVGSQTRMMDRDGALHQIRCVCGLFSYVLSQPAVSRSVVAPCGASSLACCRQSVLQGAADAGEGGRGRAGGGSATSSARDLSYRWAF